MLKKLMLTAAIGALSVSGAFAQANPPASNPPAQAAPATTSPKFIAAQSADQWVFSKFKGTDVLGPDDAHIGNVVDMLFEKSGKVDALIVGVGGFLGIGEKNVAIDLSGFQVVPADTGSKSATGATPGAVRSNNDPTSVKLKVTWTKDQLKQAADFQYYRAPAATTGMAPRTAPAPVPQQK